VCCAPYSVSSISFQVRLVNFLSWSLRRLSIQSQHHPVTLAMWFTAVSLAVIVTIEKRLTWFCRFEPNNVQTRAKDHVRSPQHASKTAAKTPSPPVAKLLFYPSSKAANTPSIPTSKDFVAPVPRPLLLLFLHCYDRCYTFTLFFSSFCYSSSYIPQFLNRNYASNSNSEALLQCTLIYNILQPRDAPSQTCNTRSDTLQFHFAGINSKTTRLHLTS
jgi:hypothetical protein